MGTIRKPPRVQPEAVAPSEGAWLGAGVRLLAARGAGLEALLDHYVAIDLNSHRPKPTAAVGAEDLKGRGVAKVTRLQQRAA